MYLPWSDCDWPDWSTLIMLCFTYGSSQTADSDSVATHDRGLGCTVFCCISHIHAFGIFGSQLEDITYFDSAADGDGLLSTAWADATFFDFCHIDKFHAFTVTGKIHAGIMVVHFVCSAYEILDSLQRFVIDHLTVSLQSDRSAESGYNAASICDFSRMNLVSNQVHELGFIHFIVTAQEYHYIFVRHILLIYHSLA